MLSVRQVSCIGGTRVSRVQFGVPPNFVVKDDRGRGGFIWKSQDLQRFLAGRQKLQA